MLNTPISGFAFILSSSILLAGLREFNIGAERLVLEHAVRMLCDLRRRPRHADMDGGPFLRKLLSWPKLRYVLLFHNAALTDAICLDL